MDTASDPLGRSRLAPHLVRFFNVKGVLALSTILLTYFRGTVFETELMGIEGVPKPEKIVTKATADAEKPAEKIGEKVASVVSEAAEAVKTVVADTDNAQEHNEL